MAVKNQLTENNKQQPKFSAAIQGKTYQKLILNTLGDSKRASRFTSAIISAVSANEKLQECDASTILSGALLGEGLNLSPSPQLGQYYLIPFNKTEGNNTIKVAQFQLGYKGYLQLAIRSGYYRKINVLPIKMGELEYFDPLEEQIKVHMIEDEQVRENTDTVGYYAMFEYLNGFRKVIYWSKKKMEKHANTYSNAFKLKKLSSFWYKDFDAMGVVHEDGNVEYIDSQISEQQKQQQITEQQEQQATMEYENTNECQQTMTNEEFFAGMGV